MTVLEVAGTQADSLMFLLLALGLGSAGWAVLHHHPRAAVALWLGVVCFVPVWMGVNFTFYWMPAVLVGVLVLVALLPLPGVALGAGDLLVASIFVLAVLPVILGSSSRAATFSLITEAAVAFTIGRIAIAAVSPRWLYATVAILFTIVAGLAVVEFLVAWNPFVNIARPNSLYEAWGQIQERGGVLRAEAAFGHSIALGCSLAMAVPLTLAAPFKLKTRVAMTLLILVGSIVTFSRVGMLCAVLGLALSVLFMRDGLTTKVRAAVIGVAVVVAIFAVPLVAHTFEAAGNEATKSAGYRGDLLSLVPKIAPVGFSDAATRLADGSLKFDGFASIDSEIILFGLLFGWLPLVPLLISLLLGVVATIARRATPATLAVVAQIPALSTVALITQYKMLFWFVAGLAVASQAVLRSSNDEEATRLDANDLGTSSSPDRLGDTEFHLDQGTT